MVQGDIRLVRLQEKLLEIRESYVTILLCRMWSVGFNPHDLTRLANTRYSTAHSSRGVHLIHIARPNDVLRLLFRDVHVEIFEALNQVIGIEHTGLVYIQRAEGSL